MRTLGPDRCSQRNGWLVVLALLLPGSALANGGPWRGRVPDLDAVAEPGWQGVRPDDRLALQDEKLTLEIGGGRLTVTVRYLVRNLAGEDVTTAMAFPGLGTRLQHGGKHPRIQDFHVTVAGRAQQATLAEADDSLWHVFPLVVPRRAVVPVHVRYVTTPEQVVPYVLRTGALWRGGIGKLAIDVDFAAAMPAGLRVLGPAGACRSDRGLRWRLTAYEPRGDLLLGGPTLRQGLPVRALGKCRE